MIIRKLKQWFNEEKTNIPIALGIFTVGAGVVYIIQHPTTKSFTDFAVWTVVGYLFIMTMMMGMKIFLEDDWRN